MIIILFQILSAFSMQLGKNVQPEYSAGGMAAFILYSSAGAPLYLSIIAGAVISYAMIPLFEAKQRFNAFAAERLGGGWTSISLSAIVSLSGYIFIYWASMFLVKMLNGLYIFADSRMTAFALMLPFSMFSEDLLSRKKSILFISGGAISAAVLVFFLISR